MLVLCLIWLEEFDSTYDPRMMSAHVNSRVPFASDLKDDGEDLPGGHEKGFLAGVCSLDDHPLHQKESIQIIEVDVASREGDIRRFSIRDVLVMS